VFWTHEVVACVGAEDLGVCCREGVIKGELDGRGRGAAIFARNRAFKEGRGFSVWPDDGLPDARVPAKEIILVLPHTDEAGFRVKKRGGREREDGELLLLRKGVYRSHARKVTLRCESCKLIRPQKNSGIPT